MALGDRDNSRKNTDSKTGAEKLTKALKTKKNNLGERADILIENGGDAKLPNVAKSSNLASAANQILQNEKGDEREDKSSVALGWLEGYNLDYNENGVLEANSKKIPVIHTRNPQNPSERLSYMPTKSEENFKYILEEKKDEPPGSILSHFLYEDPTYLGFDVLFMTDQGDFHNGLFSKDRNSAQDFIYKYSNLPSVWKRAPLLKEFRKVFRNLFYLANDSSSDVNKQKNYYLQQIGGLEKLNAKIVNYKEDKLTFTMHEDVAMYILYLTELYNNLAYDYKYQRMAIPENCLRFDMMIKISDMRNFRVPFTEKNQGLIGTFANNIQENNLNNTQPGQAIDHFHSNYSNQIYILRDCNFDFSQSQNHGENITMAGFNATPPGASELKFDIYYKSIEREMSPLLLELVDSGAYLNLRNKKSGLYKDQKNEIPNYLLFTDKRPNREIVETENTARKRSTTELSTTPSNDTGGANDILNKINNNNQNDGWWTSATDKLKDAAFKVGTDMKNTVNQEIESYKDKLFNRWREFRGELINQFLIEVREDLNVPEIYPNNVYTEDFYKITLENFAKSLGSGLYNNVEEGIRGGVNDFFTDIEGNLDDNLDDSLNNFF